MKKRIYTLVSVVLAAVFYYISISGLKGAENSQINTSTTAQDTFTNTIFNTGYNIMLQKPGLNLFSNLDSFKELNFNSIQWYDWEGSDKYGRWDEPNLTPEQIDSFNSAINSVYSEGLLGFYERSFLSYYCYAQRLIYEVASMNDDPSINNGFVYSQCLPEAYELDGGRTVIHARPNVHNPGYLCKNIYENLQHTDLLNWRQSEKGLWHLKPVMKIDTGVSPSTPVVRIDIIAFNGDTLKQIEIKAQNFKIHNGNYNGGYIDNYIGLLNPYLLEIPGYDINDSCLSKGYNENWWNWDTQCKVDFRVYWYDSCEVWFDKMIVDDERANILFDTTYQKSVIDPRIQQEVNAFSTTPGNYSFFVDEVLISQVPCIKYVFDKMRTNPNVKISIATTDNLHIRSLRNDDLPYTIFYDSLHPDFIQHDAHKFEKYANDMTGMIASVLPNTIPVTDRDPLINSSFFQDVNTYNERLQNQSLGYKGKDVGNNEQGSFLYEIYKHYYYKPSGSNTKFIMQPQIHGYLTKETTDQYYWGGLREPTNEEIQVQAAISIAHGAKGICWYIYGSELDSSTSSSKTMNGYEPFLNPSSNIKKYLYTYALLNTDSTHRHRNSYGQDKWLYVSQMNDKINSWIPVLENTYWQEGFSVHQEGAGNKYVKDIKSIYRTPSGVFTDDSACTYCDNIKYWEVGYFLPDDQTDKSKYFLMVNRRCVPETTPVIGDIRQLKIKFDSTQLTGFNNWKLINIQNDSLLTAFNKNTTNYIDAGIFQPGEGKLFKLVPVMQEGGTLVCDEAVSTSTFTCDSTVFNNGYDLKISPNTTITFSNNAGIEMNGGSFECGEYSTNDNLVIFNGTDSCKGLVLKNCSSISIYNTNINDLKNDSSETAVLISNTYDINMKGCVFDAAANSGGINISFTDDPQDSLSLNISECSFLMGSSGCDALSISSNGSPSAAVLLDWCTFTTSNDSSNALRLINVTGGAVKNSTFVNFNTTISALGSAFDLYNNKILGKTNSTGIFCADASNINLKPLSGNYLGGYNYIKNYGTSSSCINVNNSYFDINLFNL